MTSNRLDYIGTARPGQPLQLDNTANNRFILSQQPTNGIRAADYTINQILSRLQQYDTIPVSQYSNQEPERGGWCRMLKRTDNGYEFRTGGFLIHNDIDDEFIVFKNRSKNFTFAIPYRDLVLFRHNPNKRSLTQSAETFVRNLMNFTLNSNADFLVALDITTGNVFSTENRRGAVKRIINQIRIETGSVPFDRSSLQRNIRQNKNTINNFIIGYLNRENLDELTLLGQNGQIVDNNSEERLRRLLGGFLN